MNALTSKKPKPSDDMQQDDGAPDVKGVLPRSYGVQDLRWLESPNLAAAEVIPVPSTPLAAVKGAKDQADRSRTSERKSN